MCSQHPTNHSTRSRFKLGNTENWTSVPWNRRQAHYQLSSAICSLNTLYCLPVISSLPCDASHFGQEVVMSRVRFLSWTWCHLLNFFVSFSSKKVRANGTQQFFVEICVHTVKLPFLVKICKVGDCEQSLLLEIDPCLAVIPWHELPFHDCQKVVH
jgi:hypothetical protein